MNRSGARIRALVPGIAGVLLVAACGMATDVQDSAVDDRGSRAVGASPDFAATWADWSNPANGFVIDGWSENNEKRVLWQQSDVTGNGNTETTVSEGMGYGLLLAYANNDQGLFDQFLNYVVNEGNTHGCAAWDSQAGSCTQRSLLMPWLVDHTGDPFEYQGNNTSGSATDADIQIAWAVGLAAEMQQQGKWRAFSPGSALPSNLGSYSQVYSALLTEIESHDIDRGTNLYLPGNQWGAAGQAVIFSGYYTPRAMDFFAAHPPGNEAAVASSGGSSCAPASTVLCVEFANNAGTALHADYVSGKSSPAGQPVPQWSPGLNDGQSTPAVSTGYSASFMGQAWSGEWATIGFDLAEYDASGTATTQCPYQFNMDAEGNWTAEKLSGKAELNCSVATVASNSFTVTVSPPPIDWGAVSSATLSKITAMQGKGGDANGHLIVDKFDPQTQTPVGWGPDNAYPAFGNDGARFPMWVGGCLLAGGCADASSALADLGSFFSNHLVNGQLPSTGYAWTEQAPFGTPLPTGTPVPANQQSLNATALVAAAAVGNTGLYQSLVGPTTAYSLATVSNQPHANDGSVPYFNATITLLSSAMFGSPNPL